MDQNAVVASTLVAADGAPQSVFARMSARTRGMLALGFAALVAVVAATYLWSATPTYRILFTNLSDKDGGAVIAQLSALNIPYHTGDGGTITVPAERVHEARLKLASQGLPKGSVVGFEVVENQKFGVTQFQEQLNYQRGLEGELGRSISSLAPVAGARVHLALPKQSGFLRDKQPPTASVVLQLHPGKALDRQQIAGIVHLVSSSVPELTTKNVSIVDQQGNLMSAQRDGGAGLDAAQLDYVAQLEANTIKRIEDILIPLVGAGNVRAQVTADVDFAQTEDVAETYKPNQTPDVSVVRSSSISESSQPGAVNPQGVPGALSNQAPTAPTAPINGQAAPLNAPGAANGAGNSTRKDAVTNFEVDKNVRHTRMGAGQIRRLTAAVVINYKAPLASATAAAAAAAATAAADAAKAEAAKGAAAKSEGKAEAKADAAAAAQAAAPAAIPQPAPYSEKEMADIQNLVRQAMGFNTQRGDAVNVVNAAFNTGDLNVMEPVPMWKQPEVMAMGKEGGKALLFLLLTLIVVFGVLRPALKQIGLRELDKKEALAAAAAADAAAKEAQRADSDDDEARRLALAAGDDPALLPAPTSRELTPLEMVRKIAKDDPATVANVVKTWVGEGKA